MEDIDENDEEAVQQRDIRRKKKEAQLNKL